MRRRLHRSPGPSREVENQIGELRCDLCGMIVPLVGRTVVMNGVMFINSEGVNEELHMLTEHGIVVD